MTPHLNGRRTVALVAFAALQVTRSASAQSQDWYATDLARTMEKYQCPERVPPSAVSFLAKAHSTSPAKIAKDLLSIFHIQVQNELSGGSSSKLFLRNEMFSQEQEAPPM